MAIMSNSLKVEELPKEWEPSFLDIVWPGNSIIIIIYIFLIIYYIFSIRGSIDFLGFILLICGML
jgi:hypothetical protein